MKTHADLATWRQSKGWSQKQAAEALGYSVPGYIDLETRTGELPRRVLNTVLGCEVSSRTVARSLHGTTMGDLSDIEHVKDAEHELRRATTDAALADWARRWGDSWIALGHLDALETAREEVSDEIRTLEDDRNYSAGEADAAKDKLYAIKQAAKAVLKAISDTEVQRLDAELSELQELL